jgi:hypothetical protein
VKHSLKYLGLINELGAYVTFMLTNVCKVFVCMDIFPKEVLAKFHWQVLLDFQVPISS